MRLLTLLLLLLAGHVVFTQDPATPLNRDENREKTLLAAVETRYRSDLARLSGPNKKYTAAIYQQRVESIRSLFAGNQVVTDGPSTEYLNRLLQEILRANPSIPAGELRVLFSNAWWPNAASMGEGTIFFNAGLFHRLRNESQAAFVLGHELAHYLLNHGNNTIDRYVGLMYSDSMQQKIKSIQKTGYRQNAQLEALARNFAFGSHRHGRAFEYEADSMALTLLKNTSFDPAEALTCLALLDSVDRDKYEYPLDLARRFHFDVQPFHQEWVRADVLAFTNAADDQTEAEKDSLKTHPDCIQRIARLRDAVAGLAGKGKKNPVDPAFFDALRARFDYGIIQAAFDNKQVSRSLYLALRMLGEKPDELWLRVMISRCFNEIHQRQKEHVLGRYVDLPGPEYDEDYNELLHLIQNTRLRELAVISYQQLLPFRAQVEANPLFYPVWKKCIENY